MFKTLVSRCLVIGVITGGSVEAQAETFLFSGVGMTSCGKHLANSSDVMWRNMALSWSQGYLSGLNMANGAKGAERGIPDNDAVEYYLTEFCRKNPLNSLIHGNMQLYSELPKHIGSR